MWIYEKKLQYPVNIRRPDLHMAKLLFAQYGGPDSELSAGIRYLSQRYTMPDDRAKAVLTDIGTEELAHWEMIAAMIYQLTLGATVSAIKEAGFGPFYVEHGIAVYPSDAAGVPWMAAYVQSTDDPVANLTEDMAAEEKARTVYEHLLDLSNDNEVAKPLSFLRQREIVHFQRFGETLDIVNNLVRQ